MQRLHRIMLTMLIGTTCGCASSSQKQEHFSSPNAAVDSFITAVRANNNEQLKHILGSEGDALLSSGDEVADQAGRAKFLEAYDQKHELVEGDAADEPYTLTVGDSDWPFPIPIVKGKHGWYFDTAEGKDEILNRRVGRNELSTIQVCMAIVDAEHEYAERDPQGTGLPVYAAKILSDPGTKDGLYWPTAEGEKDSPLGELVAEASAEGYKAKRNEQGQPAPYHGYHYHILKSQGADAPGGARDYNVEGKMIGGFGVVAWPDQYGNSGIMTFIVNQDGVVYQKDLGPQTADLVKSMSAFDPGPGWKRVE